MNSERRHLNPQEKIAALKRHLLEGVPVSTICDELGIAPTVFDRFGSTTVLEKGVAVFEKLFLPTVEEGRRDAELIADGGDGDAFEQMPLESRDLLLGVEMTTFAVHDGTSVQIRLTRTERFSRFDRGKTAPCPRAWAVVAYLRMSMRIRRISDAARRLGERSRARERLDEPHSSVL